jgi:hypothetical protein
VGDPVDVAVAEGRQAVHSAASMSFEWATPVLFMRTPNGELYPEADLSPDPLAWAAHRPRWVAALLLALAIATGVLIAVGAWQVRFLVDNRASGSPPKPALYSVRVQVLDPEGRPVAGAKVRVSAGNEPHLLPDGWWQIEIPAVKVPADGRLAVWAEHPDWEGSRSDLRLAGDSNVSVEIPLKPPEAWLRGQVLDDHGRGVAEARVLSRNGLPVVPAMTDAQGRFALRLPVPRETRVRVTAEAAKVSGETYCYAGRDSCSIVLETR